MYSDLPELFWELVENGQGYGGFASYVIQTPKFSLKDWDFQIIMDEMDQLEKLLLETT